MDNIGKFVLEVERGFGGVGGFAHENDGYFDTIEEAKEHALQAMKPCPSRRWHIGVVQSYNGGPAVEHVQVTETTTLELMA